MELCSVHADGSFTVNMTRDEMRRATGTVPDSSHVGKQFVLLYPKRTPAMQGMLRFRDDIGRLQFVPMQHIVRIQIVYKRVSVPDDNKIFPEVRISTTELQEDEQSGQTFSESCQFIVSREDALRIAERLEQATHDTDGSLSQIPVQ